MRAPRLSSMCVATALGSIACSGTGTTGLLDGSIQLPDGSVTVDAQSLDFGTVVVYSTETKTIVLTNQSSVDITVAAQVNPPSVDQPFSVEAPSFTLNAGGMKDVQVSFSPLAASGSQSVAATLTLTPQGGRPVAVDLVGMAVASGLLITPNPLDFNFVRSGSLTLPLHIANIANQTVHFGAIALTTSTGVFSLDTAVAPGSTLGPGENLDLSVTFAPSSTPQHYVGALQISSDDHLPQQTITLQGYRGGAAIECTPTVLDFGVCPAGSTVTLPVVCTNTGSNVPLGGSSDPAAELQIAGFEVSGAMGVFAAGIDSQSSQGPILAQQSVTVDVTYTAAGTETDSATLTVVSNVTNPPAPPVLSLSGQGLVEGKCTYQLSPSTLDFGQVPPNAGPFTLPFTIQNLGPNECVVSGLGLLPGTDSVFTLSAPASSQRLSPPGTGGAFPTALTVPVVYAPVVAGTNAGALGFVISDPDAPNVQVPLSGTMGASCLQINPVSLDFGVVGTNDAGYCTDVRNFSVVNYCGQPVTLSGVTVTASSDLFSIGAATLPFTLQAGQSTSVPIAFTPSATGTTLGAGQLQTDLQQMPFPLFFKGVAAPGNTWTDRVNGQRVSADILWVMDTADLADLNERQTVADQAQTFIDGLNDAGIDFQLGVTSTDVCGYGGAEEGRIEGCPGCHIDAMAPAIVTADDPTGAADLATLMGLSGAIAACSSNEIEEFFWVADLATINGTGANYSPGAAYNTINGFIRPDALLAVITVSGDDSDDRSGVTPSWYASQFLAIKGADHPDRFSWSYINPTGFGSAGGLQPFNRLPSNIASMLSLVGGVALDTLQTDWSQGLSDLWTQMLATNRLYVLSGVPDPTSIQIYLDGPPPDQVMPGQMAGNPIEANAQGGNWNWRYDAADNAIELNTTALGLGPNDVLYIEYALACP
jgi:hypothetical protein